MATPIKSTLWTKILIIAAIFAVVFAVKAYTLHKAHSSLANYAAFRDCKSLSGQTDDSAECVTQSGQTVTLMNIGGKWYLKGDGPGIW